MIALPELIKTGETFGRDVSGMDDCSVTCLAWPTYYMNRSALELHLSINTDKI
jgi:hypothetical protein